MSTLYHFFPQHFSIFLDFMFLLCYFGFLLSVSAWLDYLLTVVMPTLKPGNSSRKRIYLFFPAFCVKYSLHSYQAAWTECVSMANSSVTLVWHISKYPFLVPEDFLQPFLNPCCLSAYWKSRKLEVYQASGEGIL